MTGSTSAAAKLMAANYVEVGVCAVFLWEFLVSLGFELDFITRKRKFTWPMITYFIGRYLALSVVCILLYFYSPHTICDSQRITSDCKSLVLYLEFAGYATNAFTMSNLVIRAMITWSLNVKIVVLIKLLNFGYWVLVVAWNVAAVPPVIVISTYATGFTGIMFLLTVTRSIAHPYKNMTVLQRLSKDGAMYFLLITAVNAIMIPPSWAKLIDIFPTALVNWMLSSRLVRRRVNWSSEQPSVYLLKDDAYAFQPVYVHEGV